MKRVALVVSCCAALILGLLPGAALANHRPNSFCSQTGDFCQSTTKNRNKPRVLQFRSFAHRGRVNVCVKPPTGGGICVRDRFRDGNDDGVFVTRMKWFKEFPNEGPGAYTVVWRQDGSRTGKKLGFHRG
ncbi:MAG TPA: hypothetical protein VFD47_02120 [Actinomycetota bacterium]|nr:hypothetical protein [Actinomycetota bacterium]